MAIDAVLFELDGVLGDTLEARRSALLAGLSHEGVAITADEFDTFCASLPVRDGVRAALALRGRDGDETTVDLVTLRAERGFGEHVGKGLSLAEGARELVEALAGRTRLAIVARAGRRQVELVLSMSGLEDAFECVIAAEDAHPPKPSPAPYRVAIARMSRRRALQASGVVALEDGSAGIRAARAAGIRCLAVGPVPAHLAMDADAYAPSLIGLSLPELERLLAANGELIR